MILIKICSIFYCVIAPVIFTNSFLSDAKHATAQCTPCALHEKFVIVGKPQTRFR